ncbi:MAG: NUDIX hydrolase [Paludibacteraceae bacterium]
MLFTEKFKYCPCCGSSNFNENDIKSKRCEDCGFIYYVNPSAATAAFILNENDELLVVRRAKEPAKGTLDLPGGFVDYDETMEECAVREIREETGVSVKSLRYIFSLPNEYLYSGFTVPTMDCFFQGRVEDDYVLRADDDAEDCFFIPVNELNPVLFSLNSIQKAIRIFIDNRELKEKKTYLA